MSGCNVFIFSASITLSARATSRSKSSVRQSQFASFKKTYLNASTAGASGPRPPATAAHSSSDPGSKRGKIMVPVRGLMAGLRSLFDSFHLCDRQACLIARALTKEPFWIERAASGIVNEAILQSVDGIAAAEHRFVNDGILARRNKTRRVFHGSRRFPM